MPVPSMENGTQSMKTTLQLYPIDALATSPSDDVTASLQLGHARAGLTPPATITSASAKLRKTLLAGRFIVADLSEQSIFCLPKEGPRPKF
jgi:hypothetical protein